LCKSNIKNDPRFYSKDEGEKSAYTRKSLKHTLTTYDFLQDHSQKVGPKVKPEVGTVRQT